MSTGIYSCFSSNVSPLSVLCGIGCPFFQAFGVVNLPHKLTGTQLDLRPINVSVANTGARLHVTALKIDNLQGVGGDEKYIVFPGEHGLTFEFGDKYSMCNSKTTVSGLK